MAVTGAKFGLSNTLEYFVRATDCDGTESELLECATHRIETCYLTNAAGLLCGVTPGKGSSCVLDILY